MMSRRADLNHCKAELYICERMLADDPHDVDLQTAVQIARRNLLHAGAHVGMHGGPCECSRRRREEACRGRPRECHCHGVVHARCPLAEPCIGGCGRKTTALETTAPGYCPHCAGDRRWRLLERQG